MARMAVPKTAEMIMDFMLAVDRNWTGWQISQSSRQMLKQSKFLSNGESNSIVPNPEVAD